MRPERIALAHFKETSHVKSTWLRLWHDDGGTVALEYVLTASIVGLGLSVGMSNLELALNNELTELGNSVLALDQSYSFPTLKSGSGASKSGTCVTDSYKPETLTTSSPSCQNIDAGVP